MNVLRDTYAVHVHRQVSGFDTVRIGEHRKVYKFFVDAVRGKSDAVLCYFDRRGKFSIVHQSDAYPFSPGYAMQLLRTEASR